ncbi:MAG: hypothetical protein HQL07_06195 [Nitrospirae bacterium]|nr:hypothetical protein [Magnetococcales bacterium]
MLHKSPGSALLWKVSFIFIIAILLGIAAVWGGMAYRDSAHQQIQSIQNELTTIKNKKESFIKELDLVKNYKPLYQTFVSKGVINQEPRIKWLETVDQIGQELKLTKPVRYKLEVRKAFDPPFSLPKGNFVLFVSLMTLNMDLLHEGDLFRFFNALEQQANGIFSVPSCSIKRTTTRYRLQSNAEWTTSLEAECALHWFTLWDKENKP